MHQGIQLKCEIITFLEQKKEEKSLIPETTQAALRADTRKHGKWVSWGISNGKDLVKGMERRAGDPEEVFANRLSYRGHGHNIPRNFKTQQPKPNEQSNQKTSKTRNQTFHF